MQSRSPKSAVASVADAASEVAGIPVAAVASEAAVGPGVLELLFLFLGFPGIQKLAGLVINQTD